MGVQTRRPRKTADPGREDDPRFRAIFEQSPIGIVLYDLEGRITAINLSALAMFGIAREEDARNIPLFQEPNLPPGAVERLKADESVRLTVPYDFDLVRERGFYPTTRSGVIILEGIFTQLGARGQPAGFLLQVQDITAATLDRSTSESALKDAERLLREKDVLLREIHHRVKNNLQVVISLLTIQGERLHDEQARHVFRESLDRIRSMALIHQRLLSSGDVACIRMQEYFSDLLSHLMQSYGVGPDRVRTEVRAGDLSLDIDSAVTSGLIVNELVSNSLKHAFPRGRTGEIAVTLERREPGGLALLVSDSGVGFPAELPPGEGGTTGLQLLKVLCEQLGGAAELNGERGMRFRVFFTPRG